MTSRMTGALARIAVAYSLLLAAACGGAAAPGTPEAPGPESPRGYPGFDTALYPGDSAMQAWRSPASPYRWVGYYLPAPCHRDASWAGTRPRLEAMGWGIGVIYVGQQAWEGSPEPAVDSAGKPTGPIICSRTLLTAERGRLDGADAIAKAAADGFPRGTVLYLDLERMTTIPAGMRDYYRAWAAALLADGRYRPGAYVHDVNVADVERDLLQVYTDAGVVLSGEPAGVPLWIAQPDPAFTTLMAPAEGNRKARVWQGRVNADEAWGGVKLRVDANVADRPSPSAP